jgi:hypothetical protein
MAGVRASPAPRVREDLNQSLREIVVFIFLLFITSTMSSAGAKKQCREKSIDRLHERFYQCKNFLLKIESTLQEQH